MLEVALLQEEVATQAVALAGVQEVMAVTEVVTVCRFKSPRES